MRRARAPSPLDLGHRARPAVWQPLRPRTELPPHSGQAFPSGRPACLGCRPDQAVMTTPPDLKATDQQGWRVSGVPYRRGPRRGSRTRPLNSFKSPTEPAPAYTHRSQLREMPNPTCPPRRNKRGAAWREEAGAQRPAGTRAQVPYGTDTPHGWGHPAIDSTEPRRPGLLGHQNLQAPLRIQLGNTHRDGGTCDISWAWVASFPHLHQEADANPTPHWHRGPL